MYKLLTLRLGFQYSKVEGSSAAGPSVYIVTSDFGSDRLKIYARVPVGLNWEDIQCFESRFLHEYMSLVIFNSVHVILLIITQLA